MWSDVVIAREWTLLMRRRRWSTTCVPATSRKNSTRSSATSFPTSTWRWANCAASRATSGRSAMSTWVRTQRLSYDSCQELRAKIIRTVQCGENNLFIGHKMIEYHSQCSAAEIQGSQSPGKPGKLLGFYVRPGIFGRISRFMLVLTL